MTSTVVIGGFFGDEGKGKIISYLALHDKPSIVVRGGAGPVSYTHLTLPTKA